MHCVGYESKQIVIDFVACGRIQLVTDYVLVQSYTYARIVYLHIYSFCIKRVKRNETLLLNIITTL